MIIEVLGINIFNFDVSVRRKTFFFNRRLQVRHIRINLCLHKSILYNIVFLVLVWKNFTWYELTEETISLSETSNRGHFLFLVKVVLRSNFWFSL